MSKRITFNKDSREKLLSGASQLANAVKVTLGPKGRNVIIDDGSPIRPPHVTKDGVTVARSIILEDKDENTGAKVIKQAAERTVFVAGDGTTSSTVLAHSIIEQGIKAINEGVNPVLMNQGIEESVRLCVSHLHEISEQIDADNSKIENVATISSNNDKEIGKLIADAFKKVGKNGVFTVEESLGGETSIEVVPGMQINSGLIHPDFVNNYRKYSSEMEKPYILICEGEIESYAKIANIIEQVLQANRRIVIVAKDVIGEALHVVISNMSQNQSLQGKFLCVKTPEFGARQAEILDDLAFMTGATIVSDRTGLDFDELGIEHLGECDKVESYLTRTVISGGKATDEEIKLRAEDIEGQIEEADEARDIEYLQSRLASLTGGVALMKVGGDTAVEMKERKDRVDDALSATKASIDEGIVAGGGTALLRCARKLKDLKAEDKDAQRGIDIVIEALHEPMRAILDNAGHKNPDGAIKKVFGQDGGNGFDARDMKYCNLIEKGVIDPAKVVRAALQNAASAASMILITECMVVEKGDN